ncbi:MAG: acyltransferase family protein [Terracidiphilus sp.]
MKVENTKDFANRTLGYRSDIDGLRAVAVLSVLAFHVGILHCSGGYVGVDVFFVISGYLISSIIFSEIANSRFSIFAFYERRIRRIFPALFAMLLTFSVFAAVFFLPSELVDFGKTSLASTFSASNFYLWKQSGYFDDRNWNPLLHTWSLAVEEQFYILFPLFLVLVRRFFPQKLRISVVVLFVLSLLSSAIVVVISQDTAFYMPYTRAWELLLGTLLSLGFFPKLSRALSRNLVAITGLGMILFSDLFYKPTTLFPGLSALVPCVASALIIGAGESGTSVVYSVLSWRPAVFIGLISYSLYLWHWPVLLVYKMGILDINAAFQRRFSTIMATDRFQHIVEIGVSLILAIISWRFVEQPFRKGRLRFAGPRLFMFAGATMLVCSIFASVMIFSGGLKDRFSPPVLQVASFLDRSELKQNEEAERLGTCFLDATSGVQNFNFDFCLHWDSDKSNYLLLGDSHAAAIWSAISDSLPNANVMQATVSSCIPTLHHKGTRICRKVMDYVYQTYLPKHPVHRLLLEALWQPEDLDDLGRTLSWAKAHGIPVVVIGEVPEYDGSLARLLAYSIAWNDPDLPSKHRLARDAPMEKRLRDLVAGTWHVPYASPYASLCHDGQCIEYANAEQHIPLMDDNHHFNRYGALFVIHRLIDEGQIR